MDGLNPSHALLRYYHMEGTERRRFSQTEDPRLFKSGKSVEKRPGISRGGSRHLRRTLYMPALVAVRRDRYLRRFYQNLLARGKARLQAVVAVMQKLLHALFAMFRTNQPYDGSKLCYAIDMAGNAIAARA